MVLDQTGLAVGLAVCTVAAGTPAYPAAVAVMPRLARHGSVRLTNMLVTAEVTAFVVGPAISGLIIGLGLAEWSIWAAAALAVIGWPLLHGLGHAPAAVDATRVVGGRLRAVLTSPGVPLAIAMVALVNFMEGGVSVALINLNATRWGADERGFGVATAALGFGALAAPLLIMVLRLRGSLLVTGGGFAAAGLAPTVALAVGPLAIAGAAGTAVECASTDVLQRSVPDRFRAFSLGLTDSIMVAAAMLGSLLVPLLSSGIGAPAAFVGAALVSLPPQHSGNCVLGLREARPDYSLVPSVRKIAPPCLDDRASRHAFPSASEGGRQGERARSARGTIGLRSGRAGWSVGLGQAVGDRRTR